MLILFSDLCEKEVINCNDGSYLGNVTDIEISTDECKVTALYLDSRKTLFGKCEKIRVPWEKIEKIGTDVIIVNICQTTAPEKCCEKPRRFCLK